MEPTVNPKPPIRKLTIFSSIDQVVLVENFLEELTTELNINPDVFANILVSVTEAVNNGILHGNKEQADKTVQITAELVTQFQLSVTVQDEGSGFDYNKVEDPTSPENLLSDHGRGVFVIMHLADKVVYNGNGNSVSLFFNI